jgi:hypothetical protein
MIALASLELEHLAASFIVDASHFFEIETNFACAYFNGTYARREFDRYWSYASGSGGSAY